MTDQARRVQRTYLLLTWLSTLAASFIHLGRGTWGRRTSYLLGTATLLVSTLLYLALWQARAPLCRCAHLQRFHGSCRRYVMQWFAHQVDMI
jgi:hypothetical protein